MQNTCLEPGRPPETKLREDFAMKTIELEVAIRARHHCIGECYSIASPACSTVWFLLLQVNIPPRVGRFGRAAAARQVGQHVRSPPANQFRARNLFPIVTSA